MDRAGWARCLALLAAFVLAGCSTTATAPPSGANASSEPSTISSAAPTPSMKPSGTPPTSRDFTVGGDRPVTVHVPPANASDTPAPLLILLHGYGASGVEQESYWRLGPVAAEEGMLYAYPDGSPDVEGARFWNGTDACCDLHGSGVDDSGYLAGLVSMIKAKANVDPKRVYFVGHSNGAFMSYRIACDHADEVAAIVSLAGATFGTAAKCMPSSPVAVLEIHGTADDTVLFGGGNLGELFAGSQVADYPGARSSVATWAAYDGCAPTATVMPKTLDLDVAVVGPTGPDETAIEAYSTGCEPGGHAELWTIAGGSHVPDLSPGFAGAVVDFLLAHPKP